MVILNNNCNNTFSLYNIVYMVILNNTYYYCYYYYCYYYESIVYFIFDIYGITDSLGGLKF